MRCIACGGLLGLREDRLLVPGKQIPKRGALAGDHLEVGDVDDRGGAGKQHDRVDRRNTVAERLRSPNHAVAANHRSLHCLPLGQADHDGNSAGMRQG